MTLARCTLVSSVVMTLAACGMGGSESLEAGSAAESTAPVVRLEGNLAQCPSRYQTAAPVPGRNAGYDVAGQSREFWLLLPPGDPTIPHPLFVAFNGTNGNGAGMIASGHLQDFADRGFIVLAPSSI